MKFTQGIFVTLLVMASTSLWSQHSLSGRVVDKDGIGLMAASCFIQGDRQQVAITDIDGTWQMDIYDMHFQDTLEIRYIGLSRVIIPVSKYMSDNITTITLNDDDNLLSEVLITSQNPISEDFSVEKLEQLDVYFNPLAKGDPLNAIQMLPASTDTEESASPSLRGSSPMRTMVIVEGVPLRSPVKFTQLNGTGNFSIFTTELLENHVVYAGNPPLTYGNSSAGLVDISLRKKADQEGWALGAYLAHVSAMWSKNINDEKGFISVFANGNNSSLFKAVNSGGLENINSFNSADGGIRVYHSFGKNANISFYNYTATENYDALFGVLAFRENALADQVRNFTVAKVDWGSERHKWTINAGYNISLSNFSYGNLKSDIQRSDLYSSINYKYISEKLILQTGLNYGHTSDDFNEESPRYFFLLSDGSDITQSNTILSQHDQQAYFYAKYYLGHFIISGALRTNMPVGDQASFLSRQMAVKYQPKDQHSLLFSMGKYHNYNYPTAENLNLRLMQSNQVSLEYSFDREKTDINVAIYHKKEDNLLDRLTSGFQIPPGTRTIKGLEFAIRQQIAKKWTIDAANTFLDVQIENEGIAYRGSNDFNYFLKVGITLFNNDVFNAGLSYISRPGRYFTGVENGILIDDDIYAPSFSNKIYTSQFNDYHNVSLTFNRQFTISDDKSFVLYGVLNNILNRANQASDFYNFDYSQRSFEYLGRRWIMVGGMIFL